MPERNDMDSLGLFSAPPSINIGYVPAPPARSHTRSRWRPHAVPAWPTSCYKWARSGARVDTWACTETAGHPMRPTKGPRMMIASRECNSRRTLASEVPNLLVSLHHVPSTGMSCFAMLLTQTVLAGKTADVTFSQFMTLSVGTPYVELGKLQQRDRNEK